MYKIPGHHHISMITKNGRMNSQFYQKVLGMRMVKKTVNQDDPSMYHLFYGDLTGSAGTELSFFEMKMAGHTVRGTNAITRIGLLVPSFASLQYWKKRFEILDVKHDDITTYAGHDALPFEDTEGLRLILINNNGFETPEYWQPFNDPSIDTEHRILGMGPVEFTVRHIEKTAKTLMNLFGYSEVSFTPKEAIYQSDSGKLHSEIVLIQQDGAREKPGRGSIHHLAIRVKDLNELNFWAKKIEERGFQASGIIDRYYFHSLYFRESNGILIEIATDGPGFTVDSSIEDLGKQLDLPPFLESRRSEIEARLQPLD